MSLAAENALAVCTVMVVGYQAHSSAYLGFSFVISEMGMMLSP